MVRCMGDVSRGGSCGAEECLFFPSSNHATSYIDVDHRFGFTRKWETHSARTVTK